MKNSETTTNNKNLESLDPKPISKTKKVLLTLKRALSVFWYEVIKHPNYLVFHPIKGFDQFKRESRGKMSVAIGFFITFFILKLVFVKYAGFEFVYVDWRYFSPFRFLLADLLTLVVFCLANWSVTTILDGKGKFKEIFMMYCYTLFPQIIGVIVSLIISNTTTQTSKAMAISSYVFRFLQLMLLFFGIMCIHEYTLTKTIFTIILTLVATGILLFTGLLFFDLFKKMYGFLYVIYREITLRGLLG